MIPLTEWFLTSSAMILAILALRAALGKKLSLGIRYALWGVVLLRLLLPFSPLTSSFSLSSISLSIQEQAEETMLYAIPTQTYENQYRYDTPHYSRTEHSHAVNIGGTSYEYANYLSGGSVSHQGQRTDYFFLMPADELFALIWKLGILAAALWMLRRNYVLSRTLKQNRTPLHIENCPIPIWLVSEDLSTPCLFGLFQPAVYLTPEAAADETTLHHVLAHELTHYAHRDHIWSFLRCVCLALHWYNPLVWLACVLSRRDGELACDEGAVKRLGEDERINYGRTLVSMVALRSQHPSDLLICSTAMAEGKKTIQQRIQLLAKRPETTGAALFLVVCAIALSLVFVFSAQSNPKHLEFTTYDQFLTQFDLSTRRWNFRGSDHWDPNDSLPEEIHSEIEYLLTQGAAVNTWVSRAKYEQATDIVSFSCIPTELKLYEMEDGCHLVARIYFEGDDPDSYLHYHQIQNQYYHLATLPSGTVQKLNNLVSPAPLTQEELNFFNAGDFFDHGKGGMNIRNQFLSSFYDAPQDINLFQLFYCGTGHSDRSIAETQKILSDIIASVPYYPDCGCTILTTDEMNKVLTEHLGLSLQETNKVGLDKFDYIAAHDAYYHFHGDTNYGLMPHFTSGQRSGNTIWLYYQDTFGLLHRSPCVLTLYQDGERYYFRANQPVSSLNTDTPNAPAGDNSHLIRAAKSFRYQEGPLSSYIGPQVTDTDLVKQAIQLLLSDDPDNGTVQPGTVEYGSTITLYGDFGSAGNEISFPITNQSIGGNLLALVRIQDQRIQEAKVLASDTYHRVLPLLSDAILTDPRWSSMQTQLWNYNRTQWNTWLLEQLDHLGFDPYFNEEENLWFIGERNTHGRIGISGGHLSYDTILNRTASPTGLTVPSSDSAVETVRSFGEALAQHYRDLDPRHPKAVTSASLFSAELFDQSDTVLCANISLAVQPIDPNTAFWMSGAGIDQFKDGPYSGEWKLTLEYRLEQQSDGTWMCTDAATGGLTAF